LLSDTQQERASSVIFAYDFTDAVIETIDDAKVCEVLRYYQIRRDK
jgi:hypothetical protein